MASINIFFQVVYALIKREARTRNGRFKFGYIWAFLEPIVYLIGYLFFRTFLGSIAPFGENAIVYLLTALLTLRTAMALTRRTMGAIQSNMALLTFPQVKTFDVIFARIVLEAVTWISITFIFISGLLLATNVWAMQIPENFIGGFSATLFFGASIGFFNATLVRIFPFWERVVNLLSFPLLFLSGILFLPGSLPPEVLNWLWWNPYLHLVEWVRSGVYLDYIPYVTPWYVASLGSVLLLFGLFLNKYFQTKMLEN